MTLIAVADRYTHMTGLIRLQVLTTVRTETRRSSETLLHPPGSSLALYSEWEKPSGGTHFEVPFVPCGTAGL
jgi:hypothetical protein